MNSITSGLANGFPGMLIFSGSLSATRLAVMDSNAVFLTQCRAAIAGLVAACVLVLLKQKPPGRTEAVPLLPVAVSYPPCYQLISG